MDVKPDAGKVWPANAFRELAPGELYTPVVPPDDPRPEVSLRSVALGVVMVVIFTFAAAYIGLKTGNVIETSIPIAILAVFIGTLYSRRSTLLENVIVQSIGQAAGVVVAGAIFTIPALYILDLQPSFLQIFLSCLVGGYLGVVLPSVFNSSNTFTDYSIFDIVLMVGSAALVGLGVFFWYRIKEKVLAEESAPELA